MAYKDLRTVSWGDKAEYMRIYKSRYDAETTIKTNFEIKGNKAFFTQDNSVIQLMFDVLRVNTNIAKLCKELPPVALRQYSRKCLIDEIVLTNNIEGIYSSRKEIGEALILLEDRSEKRGKRKRFTGLVNKYLKLLKEEKIDLKTCRDIRNIYDEIVLAEVVEENKNNAPDGMIFRKSQSVLYDEYYQVIHAGLFPEEKIIEEMEKALSLLEDNSIERLYRISIFHYMVEYIHPFYDGNGRLGRFILSYCISESLEPILAYRISETIKENKKEYYKAFDICNDSRNMGDLTPFLIMMLGMIKKAALELELSLENKYASFKKYLQGIEKLPYASLKSMDMVYELLIQATLFSELGISTAELMECCGASYTTVKKWLDMVSEAGLLKTAKEGRRKFYSIDADAVENMGLFA